MNPWRSWIGFVKRCWSIREEIRAVERGEVELEQCVLRQAPHTLDDLTDENWARPYSRAVATQPSSATRQAKFLADGEPGGRCVR